jgi:hypothetical protein
VDLAAKKKKCMRIMLKDLSDNKQTCANGMFRLHKVTVHCGQFANPPPVLSSNAAAPPTWRKDTAATLLGTWLA